MLTPGKWDLLQVFLLHKLAPALGDHQYSPRLRYILGKPIIMDYKDCAHQDSIQVCIWVHNRYVHNTYEVKY